MLRRWQSQTLILLALIIYGCAPERIPDLTSMTLREADKRTASDYSIYVIDVQESTRPKRTILSQDPRPGEIADVNEDARWNGKPYWPDIEVSISGGSQNVRVPSISGLCESRAKETLARVGLDTHGLRLNAGPEFDAGRMGEMVVAADPPAGTEVDPGTSVDMKTGTEVVNDRTDDTLNPVTIFKDDFSDPSGGLSTEPVMVQGSDYHFQDGGFRVYEERDYTSSIQFDNTSSIRFDKACASRDVIVEVDAKAIRGKPEDTSMGVVCRADVWSSEYRLGIRPDGYAIITRTSWGPETGSVTGTLAAGYHRDAIGRSGPTVHFRGECIGNKLILYVNGQKVEEATDSELGYYGDVGLFVGNEAEAPPHAGVLFDDFVVRLP